MPDNLGDTGQLKDRDLLVPGARGSWQVPLGPSLLRSSGPGSSSGQRLWSWPLMSARAEAMLAALRGCCGRLGKEEAPEHQQTAGLGQLRWEHTFGQDRQGEVGRGFTQGRTDRPRGEHKALGVRSHSKVMESCLQRGNPMADWVPPLSQDVMNSF